MRLRALPLALVVACLVALAGCGGGGGAGSGPTAASGPDPASMTPRLAAVYGEALVRPSGDLATGVLAAARKVLRVQDPAEELHRLVDRTLANDEGELETYAKNFEPWLGDRIGVFVLMRPAATTDPDVGVVLAARDRAALKREIDRQRGSGELRGGGTYRGVRYDLDKDDRTPSGAIGDFLVLGTSMRAFQAAVDASKGASLADGERFKRALEPLDDDRLAFVYADPTRLLATVDANDLPDKRLESLLKSQRNADPITLALTARADEVALELHADTGGTPLAELRDGGLSIGELPGDAWLVLATPALGPLVRSILDAAGIHDDAAAQVRGALGLDLDRDLLDPLGGLAAFARGTTPLDLGGGVLLKLDSAAAAKTLMTRLQAIANAATGGGVRSSGSGFELNVPPSPQPIVVLPKDDRIAAGYAASSAKDLLDPQQRFDDSAGGRAAIASLGDGFTPSLVVLVPPLEQLLSSLDEIGVADLSPALPYLHAYRSLAVGTKHDGDRVTVRIVAALR